MVRIPWKIQLGLVALGYVGVLGISAILIILRCVQYAEHPADVAAYGGMWAGGDLALEVLICGMLLVMSFFLVLVIYKSEPAYTIYSKIVLGVSATLPLSVACIAIPQVSEGVSLLGWACLYRVFASPMVLLGLGMSRIGARFPRAKRITTYALLTEALTLALMFLMLFLPFRLHRG